MARRNTQTVQPDSFVGTFYDTKAGVYIAVRKNGTLTVGQMNKPGVNVDFGVAMVNVDTEAV